MKLRIVFIALVIAIGSATLWAQDEHPQLTPRTAPKPQASAKVGPTAVSPGQASRSSPRVQLRLRARMEMLWSPQCLPAPRSLSY
jgi:hypothetical protein